MVKWFLAITIIIIILSSLYIYFFSALILSNPSSNPTRDATNYRLGDVVVNTKFSKNWFNIRIYQFLYNDSIAYKYMVNTKNKKLPDYDILYQILKEKSGKYEIPKDNELIIHLRIGDVVDWLYKGSIDDLLEGRKTAGYLINYEYLDNMLKKVITAEIKKVILVGGYHTREDHSRSEEYVAKIKKYIESNGFSVDTRIDKGSGDEDFIYMSNSKYFLKSGGGYSRIINRMVKMNKGIILEEDD